MSSSVKYFCSLKYIVFLLCSLVSTWTRRKKMGPLIMDLLILKQVVSVILFHSWIFGYTCVLLYLNHLFAVQSIQAIFHPRLLPMTNGYCWNLNQKAYFLVGKRVPLVVERRRCRNLYIRNSTSLSAQLLCGTGLLLCA